MKVVVKVPASDAIIKSGGYAPGGPVHKQLNRIVMRRIARYMPYRSGALIKTMVSQTDLGQAGILVDSPYARMLYKGIVMVDPKTGAAGFKGPDGQWYSRRGVKKVPSGRPIQYSTHKNPKAGPEWAERLVAAEGGQITQELQTYITKKGGAT